MRRFPCRRCPRILRSLLSSIFTEKNDFSQKLLIHQFELENSKELPVVEAHDNLSWAELTGGFWFSILCADCAARGELFWLNSRSLNLDCQWALANGFRLNCGDYEGTFITIVILPRQKVTLCNEITFTCVIFSLFALGFKGASVKRTGCSSGATRSSL